jgi:hypothetical protein
LLARGGQAKLLAILSRLVYQPSLSKRTTVPRIEHQNGVASSASTGLGHKSITGPRRRV